MNRPLLMGIVNVTPDSFSDGGRFHSPEAAVTHALTLLDEGADWLDVGGESTRPGAQAISAAEETRRVVPVIQRVLARRPEALVSVDTSKACVAAEALAVGARMVNDVTALADPEMSKVCARSGAQVVLMHMRGTPPMMQSDTRYADLEAAVRAFLEDAVARALAGGLSRAQLLVDPGLGFGKASLDNPRLIRAIPHLRHLGRVVVGASRKRFVGELSGVSAPAERVHGSVGAALAATLAGAAVLRVHDVGATRQALDVFLPCAPC